MSKHTDLRWVLLYVEAVAESTAARRTAPSSQRDRGTPQGSAISPLLANLFLHYAFDRLAGSGVPGPSNSSAMRMTVLSTAQLRPRPDMVLDAIAGRMAQVSLELHPDKTRIVYCKDTNRTGSHEHEQFNFLGYTFRPRLARATVVASSSSAFLPAVSNDAAKAIRRRSGAGGSTCAVTSPSATSHGHQTRSCEAGSPTTGASIRPGCTDPSGASTSTSFVGPGGSTSDCVPASDERGVAAGRPTTSPSPVRPLEVRCTCLTAG